MSKLFTVTKEQLIKFAIKGLIVMALAGVAYLLGILNELTSNPLVLGFIAFVLNYLQEYLTDEQGKLGGVL